jgi:hypothetical protein
MQFELRIDRRPPREQLRPERRRDGGRPTHESGEIPDAKRIEAPNSMKLFARPSGFGKFIIRKLMNSNTL